MTTILILNPILVLTPTANTNTIYVYIYIYIHFRGVGCGWLGGNGGDGDGSGSEMMQRTVGWITGVFQIGVGGCMPSVCASSQVMWSTPKVTITWVLVCLFY